MLLPFRPAIAKTPEARARQRTELDRVVARLAEGRANTRAEIRAEIRRLRRFDDLLQAYGGFRARAPMPPVAGWAIDRPGLVGLVALIEEHRPRLIVELGSGVSSVWMGYVVQRSGGRLITFDHLDEYAEITRQALAAHGLDCVVQVRTAHLAPVSLGGVDYQWYDPGAFADLQGIDLLVVDGPPGATGPAARYPALGVLAGRFAPGAIVVLDDVNREDEQSILHRWLDEVAGLSPPRAGTGRQAVLRYADHG
ncbi:MAG: class I SAM-dependent methyltransferase [Micromonosporaceae bacterium]